MTITPADVVASARSWVGTQYRHQGRGKTGVDCIGLLVVVARELDLFEPETFIPANYSRRPQDGLLERRVAQVCVQTLSPVAGCFALIHWSHTGPAAHCAILTGENMVHSYQKVGEVVEHGYRHPWPRFTHSLWLLPKVAY